MQNNTAAREPIRWGWAKGEQYIRYHDQEWGVPVHDDRTLFEFLILEGAQAGLSWSTILNKRENRRAFEGFDPRHIARYQAKKIRSLLARQIPIAGRISLIRSIFPDFREAQSMASA
jgi:DNA-3-methyladenine glycosylase I